MPVANATAKQRWGLLQKVPSSQERFWQSMLGIMMDKKKMPRQPALPNQPKRKLGVSLTLDKD
jgi:hypothetical protein